MKFKLFEKLAAYATLIIGISLILMFAISCLLIILKVK